jgi:hypothetical protein
MKKAILTIASVLVVVAVNCAVARFIINCIPRVDP